MPEKGTTPTDEAARYAADGFLGPCPLGLSADAVGEIRRHVATTLYNKPSSVYEESRGPVEPYSVAWYGCNRDRHLADAMLYRLATLPTVLDRVEALIGPDLLLWRSTLFVKGPGEAGTVLHQGHHYPGRFFRPSLSEPGGVTVWVALSHADVEHGCLQFVPGSHQRGYAPYRRVDETEGVFGRDYKMDIRPEEHDVVDVECRPGEAIFFPQSVIHGSRPNTSPDARWAIAYRFIPPAIRAYEGLTVCGQGLELSRWGCVLVRGRDAHGVNRLVEPAFDGA